MTTEVTIADMPATSTTDETEPDSTEAVEAAADAAVEIARIEAETRIATETLAQETALAAIEASAEVETARIEARNLEMELDECRQTIATLQSQMAEQTELLRSIQVRLTPVEQEPPNLPPTESAEAARPEAEAQPTAEKPKKKRLRWI